MSDESKAPATEESPWWQTGLFLAVATVMLIKAPALAAALAFLVIGLVAVVFILKRA